MPILDYKEIPMANRATGEQDQFELFARDFLVDVLHLKIISNPNRGADGGKDILAEEIINGSLSSETIKWLVSCKHKAHTGVSVLDTDELNIKDRMIQHSADGFMGFYSTLPSSGLNNRLDGLKRDGNKVYCFDKEEIERRLINGQHIDLMKRYFPISTMRWIAEVERTLPSKILGEYVPLCCEVCGKDLLIPNEEGDHEGLVVYARDIETHEYIYGYAVCRGACDHVMVDKMRRERNCVTSWDSIRDLVIPSLYLDEIFSAMNSLFYSKKMFSPEGYAKFREITIALSQMVMRNESTSQVKRANMILRLKDSLP